MNPAKWFGNLFCPVGSGQRDFNYSRNANERLCTDPPGSPEWDRFWDSWDTQKYFSANPRNASGVHNFNVNLNRQISKGSRNKKKSPLFCRIFPSLSRPKKRKMKMKIVNLDLQDAKCQQILDVTKIRASGYKIKSCGFPVTACTSRGSTTIKVEVGSQPDGLLTTRINSCSKTIHMEVVGVNDHLIQKSLIIKAKTSAQVIELTSPISDSEGFLLFKIP